MNDFLCVVRHVLGLHGFEVMGELTAEVFDDIFISFFFFFFNLEMVPFKDLKRMIDY
jgi:hypothetical protein